MRMFLKLLKALFWYVMNFIIKYVVITYYSVKYFFKKPQMEMRNGLMPVSYKQTEIVKFSYQQLIANGKKPREARRIIEKKLKIKVLTK